MAPPRATCHPRLMLPPRAYAERAPRFSPGPSARPAVDARLAAVVVVPEMEADRYPSGTLTRYAVHTTQEALRMIETSRPRVVVIDWDASDIGVLQVCAMAQKFSQTGLLMVTSDPKKVPAGLRAGCHAVLLKPLAPNLVAARVGRLARELPSTPLTQRAAASMRQSGTNRVWPETHCPQCDAPNAVSFEFQSYRRMWYACLTCDHVWLGPRQE